MKIYSILGVEIADIPIQENAVHERELMKSDFIRLEWSQSTLIELPCGSYIEYDGVKYRLLKDYVPEQQSTLQWDYSPEFQHPIMMLGTIPFIHIDGDTSSWKSADKETEWNWTGMAVNLIQEAFVPFLNKFGADNEEIGTDWTAVVDSDLKASETCSFQSMDFMSALTHAAQQFECEWHLDYDNKILYFGHVNIMTEELVFEVGENIDKPTITENKNGYYNAYIAKGSTRNISQVNDKGENIQVNKRLKLNSEKYPDGYIDRRQSPSEPLVVKELIYEDIYPSLDLYVYAPKARTRLLLDEDDEKIIDKYDEYGNPIYKKYSIWYVRLAYKINDEWKDFEITKDMLLGTLSCQFQGNENSTKYTSPLAGREFELKYHESDYEIPSDPLTGDTGVSIKKGDYEIIYDESNGLIIPTTVEGGMYPRGDETPSEDNNILRLYNIALPNEYISHAQEELEKQALEDILYWESDRNSYEFNSNPIVFKQNMPKLFIGRGVKYKNGSYELDTRISKIIQKIDYPFEAEITVGNEEIKGTTTTMREQLQMVVSALSNGTGGMSVEQFKKMLNLYGGTKYLSKTGNDTAQGLIIFLQGLVSNGAITAKQGVEIGSFVTGLIGGSGARIDKDGNGELESLVIRQFLEVPELRFNRIDVVSGELWNSICFGTIEAVDTKKRIVTLKLQDGELSGIEVGDICRGVFHCLESSNPSADMAEDECGFQQMAGFSTSYFTPTEVYDDGARFKYSLRSGTSVHPQVGMKFAVYGSFTNPARRASAYHTRTYTRYLNAVDTWRISPDKNIYGQQGNLEGLTINEMEMHGYGGYFHNIYMSGVHVEFDRDWLDHNLPKVYSVHLTTYEHTIVTDIEGNPLNGLEELRNVTTGESNVMSGDDNVIATRLAVTTTILAHKGTTPLLYSDTMDEGRFIVTLACVGCTAEVDNGVVKVTSIDKESAEHYVDISVNCEGEGVYVQTFNIPMVKQGENGITADLDNEMASIAANDKGEPLVVPFEEIVSHGRMWYGNEPMYLTSAEIAVPGGITVADVTTITDSEGQHNYLPIDTEHKQCTLRITKVDASAADTNEIRISLTGRVKQELNTEYSKTVVFKLNKVRMGENAQNYSLMVSTPQMQVDGKGNFTTAGVSCSVIGSDGKTLSELTAAELGNAKLTLKAQLYNGVSDYGTEQDYTYKSTLGNGSVIGGKTLSKDSVRLVFLLYWDGLLIDKEGVPIVKNGSSTVRIDLDNENDSMLYNDAGSKVSADCVTNVKVFDGSKDVTSLCTISIDKTENVTASISGTKCTVSAVAATSGYVQIKALYPADGNTYYTIFSIKRLVGEDKYEIITSPTSVAYNPNTGALSHSYVVADVYRTDQTGTRTKCSGLLSNYAAGMLLQFSYDSSTWSSAISAGYSIPANSNYPNIYIRITDAKETVRDYETVPLVVGGEDGEDGRGISSVSVKFNAGTDYRYNYCTWKSTSWTSNSPDVDYTYKYLWKQTKTKYTDATEKTDYECIGKIGDKGIDGNGTEWIYYLNNSETFDGNDPSAWAASQEDDYIKSGTGWTDDPTGVSATKRFEWIAKRSKTNGTWGKFTPPHIWAKYGEKGEQGEPGTPGEPGADATSYWLDIEVTHVGLSASGSWSPSLIGMYVRKKKGDEAVSNCYDFYVSAWGYDGSSYTLVKAGSKSSYFYFSTSDAGKYSAFVIVLSSNDPSSVGYSSLTIVDRETITITTEKAVGSVLVDRGVFSSGNTYSWKYDNDRKCWMRDMVLYKASDGNYYRYAIKSMGQEGVTSYPSSTSYWEQLSTYKTIITDCLYADNATIGGFYVNASQFWSANNKLTLDGKNGNITISGKLKATDAEITGVITATSGTFDNCTIKDTCTITKIDAVKGTIGGMTISNNSISSTVNGSMILSSGGLSCNYNNAYMYSGIINFIDISNGNVSKTSASIEIGNSTTGLQAMINLTNTFAMFKVPIYLPSLPKYAAAKSGQLCVGDGDQHIYLKP